MEKEKKPALADDMAYTVNHAFACTATDLLSPYIGNLTQTYLGKRIEVGCGHNHAAEQIIVHTPACDHTPHEAVPSAGQPKKGLFTGLKDTEEAAEDSYKRMRPVAACDHDHKVMPPQTTPITQASSNLRHWWIGELAGDFGAVPFTVALQRFAPGMMRGIRHVLEPVLAPLFHRGAKRSAAIEAERKGDTQNVKALENSIYEREMSHIPQAFIWTVSSSAINLVTQKLTGNKGPVSHLMAGKLAGAATSAALVVGFRGFAPQQAYHVDQFTSRYLFEPASRLWQKRIAASPDRERAI